MIYLTFYSKLASVMMNNNNLQNLNKEKKQEKEEVLVREFIQNRFSLYSFQNLSEINTQVIALEYYNLEVVLPNKGLREFNLQPRESEIIFTRATRGGEKYKFTWSNKI